MQNRLGSHVQGRSSNRRYACSRPPSATTGLLGGNCRRCPAAGRSRRRTCWQRSDRRVPRQPRVRGQAGQRPDAQGQPRPAARPVRDRARGVAHPERAVRPAQEGPDRATGGPYVDPEVDYSALVAKRSAPCWLRALADAGLLEQAPWRRFERYGPSPPAVRRRIAPGCIRSTAGLSAENP